MNLSAKRTFFLEIAENCYAFEISHAWTQKGAWQSTILDTKYNKSTIFRWSIQHWVLHITLHVDILFFGATCLRLQRICFNNFPIKISNYACCALIKQWQAFAYQKNRCQVRQEHVRSFIAKNVRILSKLHELHGKCLTYTKYLHIVCLFSLFKIYLLRGVCFGVDGKVCSTKQTFIQTNGYFCLI